MFVWVLYLQLDRNRDGHLNVHELKAHIRNHECGNLPENLAAHILKMHDDDFNGQLDFEEFYQMSIRQEWLFSRAVAKYCKLIVPSPHRPEQDEIGKQEKSLIFCTSFLFNSIFNNFLIYDIIIFDEI